MRTTTRLYCLFLTTLTATSLLVLSLITAQHQVLGQTYYLSPRQPVANFSSAQDSSITGPKAAAAGAADAARNSSASIPIIPPSSNAVNGTTINAAAKGVTISTPAGCDDSSSNTQSGAGQTIHPSKLRVAYEWGGRWTETWAYVYWTWTLGTYTLYIIGK